MISFNGFRRRLTGLLVGTLAAFFATSVMAAPAHATLGSPQTVDIQLNGHSGTGGTTPVGRLVGTLQFDDSNSLYRLDLTVCRQSSLVDNTVRVFVNGAQHQAFNRSGPPLRPDLCPGSSSWGISGTFTYNGIINTIKLRLDGVYFDGATSTAKTIIRESPSYNNPFD